MEAASTEESADVGMSSYFLDRLDVAERALRRAWHTRPGAGASSERRSAATAGFNLGLVLGELNRPEEAVAAFDRVVDGYADDPAPALREPVAGALVNKGATLGQLGRRDEAVAAYDRVVDGYPDDPAPARREVVERARPAKGLGAGRPVTGRTAQACSARRRLQLRGDGNGLITVPHPMSDPFCRAIQRIALHWEFR